MRQRVESCTEPYTVRRHTDSSDDDTLGAPSSNDYTELSEPRELYLYDERHRSSRELEGDVVDATVEGLALADADIQVGDRVDYGSHTYEVMTLVERPPTGTTQWYELELERV